MKKNKLEQKNEKLIKKAQLNQRVRVHNELLAYQKKHKKERKIAPKDVFLSLQHINKIYDNHVQAVYDFNLDIKKHEFIVFVGPSGCGKSTTLRMIAGLENITSGDLYIDGVYSNDLESKNRDIAMVFQSYALYPQLSVEGNMSFGLKIRKVPTQIFDKDGKPLKEINKGVIKDTKREIYILNQYKNECEPNEIKKVEKDISELEEKLHYLETTPVDVYKYKHLPKEEIEKRVNDAMEILQIKEYADRKPKALSGGQCQRVALGRAIVRNAKVFLMDEPLSNLDAKLRVQMRSEIVKLHKRLKATTIYVTHDQTEAMTMATRLVVMSKGYIQQVGTPIEIYNHPANLFVATFIGSPSMNLFEGTFEDKNFLFANNEKLELPNEFIDSVGKFYLKELDEYKKERESLLANFVERNDLIKKLEEIQSLNNETKYELQIKDLKEQIETVTNSNTRLSYLNDAIKQYEEFLRIKKYNVIFGIRPEDIYQEENKLGVLEALFTKPFECEITVSELLGHEYFVHVDFAGKDLVSKISSTRIIEAEEKIKLVLNLKRAHLFDKVSGKLIY